MIQFKKINDYIIFKKIDNYVQFFQTVITSNWILITGFWNDLGIWEDDNIWID